MNIMYICACAYMWSHAHRLVWERDLWFNALLLSCRVFMLLQYFWQPDMQAALPTSKSFPWYFLIVIHACSWSFCHLYTIKPISGIFVLPLLSFSPTSIIKEYHTLLYNQKQILQSFDHTHKPQTRKHQKN